MDKEESTQAFPPSLRPTGVPASLLHQGEDLLLLNRQQVTSVGPPPARVPGMGEVGGAALAAPLDSFSSVCQDWQGHHGGSSHLCGCLTESLRRRRLPGLLVPGG